MLPNGDMTEVGERVSLIIMRGYQIKLDVSYRASPCPEDKNNE